MHYDRHSWQTGETITAEKLNCIEGGLDGACNCSEVWKNSSPLNSFAAQDILIDTTGYESFEFCFIIEDDDIWQNIVVTLTKNRSYLHNGKYNSFVKYGNYERKFSISDDRITFDDCLYAVSYNGKLIPYSIHAFV